METPTPKEKAQELFQKMKGFRVKHSHSKKCARLCVEEILITISGADFLALERYWNEVKEELNKI